MKIYTDLRVDKTKNKYGHNEFAIFQYGRKDPMTVGMTMPEAVLLKSRLEKIVRVKPN